MEFVVKIGLLGIVVAVIGVQLKSVKSEYSVYIGIVCTVIIGFYLLEYLQKSLPLFDFMMKIKEDYQFYIEILFKMIGITYICEFCSSICRESGYGALANQIEIFGKLSILMITIPVAQSLFDVLGKFL